MIVTCPRSSQQKPTCILEKGKTRFDNASLFVILVTDGKEDGLYKKELPWYSCLDCHSLGECLRALREKEGLTQKQVANYLQLSRSTYTYYELEKRQPILQNPFPVGGVLPCQYRLPAGAYAILKDGI